MTASDKRIAILKTILKPLARFCSRNAYTIQEVIEALKHVMADAAAEVLTASGEKVTTSRIAIMSGLTRKDVIRVQKSGESAAGPAQSLTARIIGYWENDKFFCDKRGKPRILSYSGENGDFKRLVNSVSTDLNPATVFFELSRIGAVRETYRGIELIKGIARLQNTQDRGLNLLSRDIETLALAAQENFESPHEVKNLHLRTECDNMFESDIPKVRQWLLQEGNKFHRKLRAFLARHDRDFNRRRKGKAGKRAVIGTFSWTSPTSRQLTE